MPRNLKANQQSAQTARNHINRGSQIEMTHPDNKNVSGRGVEEAPTHVHSGRGKALAWRLGKGRLKRASHRAAYKMRNSIGEKHASEKVRKKMKPVHIKC